MKTMTRPERLQAMELLKAWKREYDHVMVLMLRLKIGFGDIHPENRVFTTVWDLFDVYTQTLQIAIGDKGGWCQWHMDENEMGTKALEAGYDGKTKPIKSLSSLLALIVESGRRG